MCTSTYSNMCQSMWCVNCCCKTEVTTQRIKFNFIDSANAENNTEGDRRCVHQLNIIDVEKLCIWRPKKITSVPFMLTICSKYSVNTANWMWCHSQIRWIHQGYLEKKIHLTLNTRNGQQIKFIQTYSMNILLIALHKFACKIAWNKFP